jgi:hypothetical protein
MFEIILKKFGYFGLELDIKALVTLLFDECFPEIFVVVIVHLSRRLFQSVSQTMESLDISPEKMAQNSVWDHQV